MKRPIGDSSQRSRNRRAKLRLFLEPLEARRLLAGLNISVLLDQDGSRNADPADTSAARRLVYLDINHNQTQDDSDPIAFTNIDGVASFSDIPVGTYEVSLVDGNQTQRQSFPVSVDEVATPIAQSTSLVIASSNLDTVWSIDATGKAQSIGGNQLPSTQLPGPVSGSVIVGNEAWLIVTPAGLSSNLLMRFDLSTGQYQPLPFLGSNSRSPTQLISAGTTVVARLMGSNGAEFVTLQEVRGNIRASNSFVVSSSAKAFGSTSQNQFAVIEPITSTFIVSPSPTSAAQTILASQLSIYDAQTMTRIATRRLRSEAVEAVIGEDGKVFAAFRNGGVEVFNNDSTLSEVALLPEASTPIAANSSDGRVVTGNATNKSELIVWSSANWLPTARTRLPEGNSVTRIQLADDGDQWIATGPQGVFQANLAKPLPLVVTVLDGQVNSGQLGVQIEGVNSAPIVTSPTLQLPEDNVKGGQLRSLVQDKDNDTLWFSVLSNPAHGRVELTPSGAWNYVPSKDFNGQDQATFRAMDGQSATNLTLTFNVTPVNDPPQALEVKLGDVAIPENLTAGMNLGTVAVQDPDANASYHYLTSDSRFQVRDGQLYLSPNAQFDYEQQSAIELKITAIDDKESGYQITTLTTINISDTNEPPTAVRILNANVAENALGMSIGDIIVDDPDKSNHFEYVVSDSRFEIVDGKLRLKPDVKLDYEAAPNIDLTVTVDDGSGKPVATTVKVSVIDKNDPPTAINITTTGIEENKPGAVVGTLSVVDQDLQAYTYTVSDPRFEVVDGKVKLADGKSISKSEGLTVVFTVTATTGNSDKITETLVVPVNTPLPTLAIDVNRDGEITPVDAIIIIGYLNKNGPGPKRDNVGSGEDIYEYDVNGDGVISPLDVLIIIRHLNAIRNRLASGEGESSQQIAALPIPMPSSVEADRDSGIFASGANVENAAPVDDPGATSNSCHAADSGSTAIDNELEGLLEQLSVERLKRKSFGR